MTVGLPLILDDVTLSYARGGVPVVRNVSLQAAAGAITAIVGPNGSGKSSIVRGLLGLMPVREGRTLAGEHDLVRCTARDVSRLVAVMPQREALAFPMSVREYVALARAPFLGLWDALSSHDTAIIDAAMMRADVLPFATRRTDELSGGEWQRVRLARALAQDTPILVLDEPTTFLDIAHEMATFETLSAEAQAGRTIVLVSHTLTLVARFADRMTLMHEGRVAASGAPRDVMQASTLEQVYGWPLVVSHDPAVGAPTLVPLRRPR
ncbi:MAG TPA: ABC transporter ATP-binding protein [Gemmatimonadaceae bacterium]|nr:ABC transporter ATP-binding protein [Gemmatimonadaceae bacterium]